VLVEQKKLLGEINLNISRIEHANDRNFELAKSTKARVTPSDRILYALTLVMSILNATMTARHSGDRKALHFIANGVPIYGPQETDS
jgi:hypothetical protein